jgi:hypothetical protein
MLHVSTCHDRETHWQTTLVSGSQPPPLPPLQGAPTEFEQPGRLILVRTMFWEPEVCLHTF